MPSFVPNDTFLMGGPGLHLQDIYGNGSGKSNTKLAPSSSKSTFETGTSMLLMTGPNYSGKSVYLKQVAIIVYMAHVGCFVPADRATIGLTDKILTRVATRETVSKFSSAFMIDLQQVTLAMANASRRSLLIIDEFGKGTDTSDGAGLACGVFEHLLGLGSERPKVLGATHFHEIFEIGFLRPQTFLSFAYMEVRFEQLAEEAENQIIYLYNLRSGRKNSSHGSQCAAVNGVDAAIVARSEELEDMSARGEDLVPACATITKEEEDDLKMAEVIARDFLAQDLRALVRQDRTERNVQRPRKVLEQMF